MTQLTDPTVHRLTRVCTDFQTISRARPGFVLLLAMLALLPALSAAAPPFGGPPGGGGGGGGFGFGPQPGGFNAYDTTTAAGSISGYITTKIAGAAFNIDLIALNKRQSKILKQFTGTVKVELLDGSSGGTCSATVGWPVIQTLAPDPTFSPADQGVHSVSITENNSWPNVWVRISYPATGAASVVSCSNNNFAIRPNSFAVSVSDNDWGTPGTTRTLYNTAATGGNVHKAEQPFTITASAYNAQSTPAITTNYAGSPTAVLLSCLQPTAGCTLGALSAITGAGVWTAASGVVTSNSATYSDAGAFTLQLIDTTFASVDNIDVSAGVETAAQLDITSASISVGRFVPDHFSLAPTNTPEFVTFNTTDSNCGGSAGTRSFTYIGQPFAYLTVPQASITAQNAGGGTTLNYSNTLWHNPVPTSIYANTPSTPNTLDTSLTTAPLVTANNNGTGNAVVNSTDEIAYTRNLTAPQSPFNADISLTLSVADSSESTVTGNGVINTNTPAVFSGASNAGIAFDSGTLFRYGRLSIVNANGAVSLYLPIPMQAQYWNGANFITNSADNCTRISASNITMGNYTKNLTPCNTALSISGPLVSGVSNLLLFAPGAGHNGSVDLTVNLQAAPPPSSSLTCLSIGTTQSATTAAILSYLQGKWSGTSYDLNPTARAAFGIYKNANQFIFMREVY